MTLFRLEAEAARGTTPATAAAAVAAAAVSKVASMPASHGAAPAGHEAMLPKQVGATILNLGSARPGTFTTQGLSGSAASASAVHPQVSVQPPSVQYWEQVPIGAGVTVLGGGGGGGGGGGRGGGTASFHVQGTAPAHTQVFTPAFQQQPFAAQGQPGGYSFSGAFHTTHAAHAPPTHGLLHPHAGATQLHATAAKHAKPIPVQHVPMGVQLHVQDARSARGQPSRVSPHVSHMVEGRDSSPFPSLSVVDWRLSPHDLDPDVTLPDPWQGDESSLQDFLFPSDQTHAASPLHTEPYKQAPVQTNSPTGSSDDTTPLSFPQAPLLF